MRARTVPTVLLVAGVLAAVVATPGRAVDRPAAGRATSTLSLLSASSPGSEATVGTVELRASTEGGAPDAGVVVTPLLRDGTPTARQEVAAGQRRTVQGVGTAGTPGSALVAVTGPTLDVGAQVLDGVPLAGASATDLGSAQLLGLPVRIAGQAGTTSTVTSALAQTAQVLELRDVELPSVAALLAALGLDLGALPVDTLRALVTELDLADGAVAATAATLDAARTAAGTGTDAARAVVADRRADLAAAQQGLAAATAALAPLQVAATQAAAATAAARTAAEGALTAAAGTPVAEPTAAALAEAQRAEQAAGTAVAAGEEAVRAAEAAVAQAQQLLDAALDAVSALLLDLGPETAALRDAVLAALDRTPLLRLDALTVGTRATVTSAAAGGQQAEITGGRLEGLQVLGTDVVDQVTGRSALELGSGADGALGRVSVAVEELTGTLSHVLSTVPGLPALQVPAPVVQLLVRDTSTGVQDGAGTAATRVLGLRVTLPPLALPVEVALPDAPALAGAPVLAALPEGVPRVLALRAVGDVLTTPATTLGLGALSGTARFRPAAATGGAPAAAPVLTSGVPGTAVPAAAPPVAGPAAVPSALPRTGAPQPLAVLALGLVVAATWLRRRLG